MYFYIICSFRFNFFGYNGTYNISIDIYIFGSYIYTYIFSFRHILRPRLQPKRMTTLFRLPVAPRFLAAKLKAWPRWWSHSSQAPDCHLNQSSLVGGLNPSEKYESQLGLLFQYMENKSCSKPPTSYIIRAITCNNRNQLDVIGNSTTLGDPWKKQLANYKMFVVTVSSPSGNDILNPQTMIHV